MSENVSELEEAVSRRVKNFAAQHAGKPLLWVVVPEEEGLNSYIDHVEFAVGNTGSFGIDVYTEARLLNQECVSIEWWPDVGLTVNALKDDLAVMTGDEDTDDENYLVRSADAIVAELVELEKDGVLIPASARKPDFDDEALRG